MAPLKLLNHDVNPENVTHIDWGTHAAAPVRIHFVGGGDPLTLQGEEATFARSLRGPVPSMPTATATATDPAPGGTATTAPSDPPPGSTVNGTASTTTAAAPVAGGAPAADAAKVYTGP